MRSFTKSFASVIAQPALLALLCGIGNITIAAECDVACDELSNQVSFDPWACDGYEIKPEAAACFCDQLNRSLAESGILFQSNLTQFYFGTVDGGVEETDRYGGHGDYLGLFDFGKLGVQEGLFLQVRAEHRFGRSINEPAGVFLPPTLATDLPVTDSRDLFLTNFLLTQALSETFVVFGGKLDTLDGDKNAFAHGRGIHQFSNSALVANPVALRTIPYSTIGFGFATLLDGEPLFNFTILNAIDTADSFGLDELFAEGAAISTELRLPTNFRNKPGHVLLGGTWSSRNFASLDQDPRIVFPSVPIDRKSDSWSLYFNTDQYLVTESGDSSRGWGLFTRGGISDEDTNPIGYFLSAGIGGNSPLRGRKNDTFGIGYYYAGLSDQLAPFIAAAAGNVGDGSGTELFYNVQATEHVTITPDLQFLDPGRASVDNVAILGVRVNISL